ncbi:hypothetical protein G5B40_02900 [Pikeienuella piscinae]|uniref:PEP-CTERM protein-sorting domain-containing protein n=1 Tax=Pikeienuella piscinae TaxID=2748098 RepID=A0A7L5BW69_9RHOB|nr:hypothetical protein [Pikeienuella piscinae]QIE54476.1 hypothetical protein G5B40_02900 [Pikeienuella piscinae]
MRIYLAAAAIAACSSSSVLAASLTPGEIVAGFAPGGNIGVAQTILTDTRFTFDPFSRDMDTNAAYDDAAVPETGFSGAHGAEYAGYANLGTGELGLSLGLSPAGRTGGDFTSVGRAAFYDIVRFSDDATLDLAMAFDGSIANSDATSADALASLTVNIFDVTGMSQIFFESDGDLILTSEVYGEGRVIGVNSLAFQVASDESRRFPEVDGLIDSSGTPNTFAMEEAFSASVLEGRDYLVLLSMNAVVNSNEGFAFDMLNTGSLAFTDLGGASYTSNSGVFLSEQPPVSTVPVPPALAHLAVALFGLGVAARRRRRRS